MKEEVLEKVKIENLRTKIYLMIINLDLNIIESHDEERNHLNGFLHYFLNLLHFINLFRGFFICFPCFLFLYSSHPYFFGMLSLLSQNIFSLFLVHFMIYL